MAAPPPTRLVCPRCKGALEARGEEHGELCCARCAVAFPTAGDIADFAEGKYYDDFQGPEVLSAENLCGLANESEGARIDGYYAPLLDRIAAERGISRAALRVLDSGCGNGESVDALSRLGFEAWGHDLSALRKWQWRERERRDRLVVAGGETLPFPGGAFDIVIASGVLEHVGVSEEGGGRYRVVPMPDRDARRRRYLAELLRVLAPQGRLFLDFPNGAFPIDFWHGVKPGGARFHGPGEGFLPTVSQIRVLCAGLDGSLRVTALSPEGRLRFRQVSFHWYGRLLRAPMAGLYRLMSTRAFGFLAASPVNPYLVIEVTQPEARN
ncbi:MAG TPA: methyltransferase domain-containing protein [Thermoanaerobaculia bacterium]